MSLDELPRLEKMDAVIIDGDHNWYSVYNELKLLARQVEKGGPFPLSFVHDVGWPYGRRDRTTTRRPFLRRRGSRTRRVEWFQAATSSPETPG